MKFLYSLLLVLIIGTAAAATDNLQLPVEKFTLENGMTFLIVERHTAPVFSGFISVRVGSGWEKIGNIGTAHLFEHMMFKGSETVGTTDIEAEKELWVKEDSIWARIDNARQQTRYIRLNQEDKLEAHLQYIADLEAVLDSLAELGSQYVVQNEFDEIYTRNGGAEFNATTGYDFTQYFVSLPSNRLELWFNMESDRLKKPALREFFPERNVVSEERRQSVENNSDSKLFEQLMGVAFIAHPYQIYWEWQSEENNLTRSDLMNFFHTYYIPQRMVAAVVGDVTVDQVKAMAEKYFGDIQKRPDPEPLYTREPEQQGERRVDLHYEANPAVFIAYHKTAFDSPDEPVFKVIERLLGEGRTSRLYKALVLEKQLCIDVEIDVFPGSRFGDLFAGSFNIYAYPKEGITTAQVEEAIYDELKGLATKPVDSLELTKVKNNIEADYIWSTYHNMGMASSLATAQNLARDWRYLYRLKDKLMAVTADDIRRVAGRYLIENNRTVATLIPLEKGAEQ